MKDSSICLRAGLYVTTNGTLSFLCLMGFCSALCLGISDTMRIYYGYLL